MTDTTKSEPKVSVPGDGPVLGTALDGLSRQPQFSTYKENTDQPDNNPPPGRAATQELGKPHKGKTVQGQ